MKRGSLAGGNGLLGQRWAFAALVAAACLISLSAQAANSPFGIATPDSSGNYFGGPLGPIFAWVAVHQAAFYRSLTTALSGLKANTDGIWLLLGLSFAYGVFHAVGPGHGKAVISSYLMSSGESARRGVALSFLAALVQAASAIIIVAIGRLVLNITATTMTSATDTIEVVSYAAIALFGAWLLWGKLRGGHHHHHHHYPAETAPTHDHSHHGDCDHDHHAHGEEDEGNHNPDGVPARTAAARPGVMRAWSAVLSVGIRPCSGAIIVLVFAWSQGLFAAGVAATLVMALGTGLTVASLATLAVSAKGVALRLAKGGTGAAMALRLARGIEIAGAAAVLLLGLLLLGGALGGAGAFAGASQF